MLNLGGMFLSCCSHRIDIRQLDFVALKAAGYRGAVVDKDNCLVCPPYYALVWCERVSKFTGVWVFFSRPCLIVMNSSLS